MVYSKIITYQNHLRKLTQNPCKQVNSHAREGQGQGPQHDGILPHCRQMVPQALGHPTSMGSTATGLVLGALSSVLSVK